jgi:cytochrome c553
MNHSFIATVVSLTVSGIAHADVTAGEDKARLCSLFCHNNERYAGSLAPLLEGQPAPYLYNQLKAFKEKRRANTGMDVPTSSMTEDDMRDISEFFAAQPIPATPFKPDPSKVAIGRQSAQDLKCAGCHQSDYKGKINFPSSLGNGGITWRRS